MCKCRDSLSNYMHPKAAEVCDVEGVQLLDKAQRGPVIAV